MSKWQTPIGELPPLPKLLPKKRDLFGPIVIGCFVVIAMVASFVGVSYVIGTEPPALTQVDYTPQ